MINFYCFKWGTRYHSNFVNRLFRWVSHNYDRPFTFTCITEDPSNLDSEILVEPLELYQDPTSKVFTIEKAKLMFVKDQETNILLDLDIVFQNSFVDQLDLIRTRPIFIWNYWQWNRHLTQQHAMTGYHSRKLCYINSSFVGWKGDSGKLIWEFYQNHKPQSDYHYDSLDRMIFYHLRDDFDYWPEGFATNYNFGKHDPNAKVCLFNTSHIWRRGLNIKATELKDAKGWAKELWERYD